MSWSRTDAMAAMATTNLDAGYTYTFHINLANGSFISFTVALR